MIHPDRDYLLSSWVSHPSTATGSLSHGGHETCPPSISSFAVVAVVASSLKDSNHNNAFGNNQRFPPVLNLPSFSRRDKGGPAYS
jgi:hypothetical protein